MKKDNAMLAMVIIIILFGLYCFGQAKPYIEDCDGKGQFTINPDGFQAKYLTSKCK